MLRRGSARAFIGGLCIAVAATVVAWRTFVLNTTRWVSFDVPLPLEPGRVSPREFAIDREGSYEIVVKISRPPEGSARTSAECLLGFDLGNPHWGLSGVGPLGVTAPVVDLAWHLRSQDGQPVVNVNEESVQEGRASGLADAGGFRVGEVNRWLGSFITQRGSRYTLGIETHANATALKPFGPRIVVQPSPSMNHDEVAMTTVLWLYAALSAGSGAALIVSAMARRRRTTQPAA